MSEKRTRVRVYAEVEIPKPPNFLRTPSATLPVSAFPDHELRRIGELWTEQLIERAAEQRRDVGQQGGSAGS